MSFRILILGGTTEARVLASRLAGRDDLSVTLSLAGRTQNPVEQPVATRVGGFGGPHGLAAHLKANRIGLLIDATHPFAARISQNAILAAGLADAELLILRRPEWVAEPGDTWQRCHSVAEAITSLGSSPRNVFVALGRQELAPLEHAAHHRYVVRSVDPVEPPLAIANVTYILDRGPFAIDREVELFRTHGIEAVLCKNSGGAASHAKIAAARSLDLPVFMISRPAAGVAAASNVDEALRHVDHWLGADRGE